MTDEESSDATFWETLNTNDVKRLSWAQEIEDMISVFDKPVQDFLDVFVPGPTPSRQPSNNSLKDDFREVGGKDNKPYLVRRVCT